MIEISADQREIFNRTGVRQVPASTHIFEEVPDSDTMGGRLSRARDAIGLSERELAQRLGVGVSTVRAWERDRSMPTSHRLATTCGLLGVSLSWMLHGVGTGPRNSGEVEVDEAIHLQIGRLKALHAQTGALIARMQGEIGRS